MKTSLKRGEPRLPSTRAQVHPPHLRLANYPFTPFARQSSIFPPARRPRSGHVECAPSPASANSPAVVQDGLCSHNGNYDGFLTSFYSSHLIRKRGLVKVGGRSASGGGCVYVSPQPLRGLPSEALKAERLSLLDSDCFWRIDPSPRAPEVNLNPISPNQGSPNP